MQISAIAGGGGTGSLELVFCSFRNLANTGAAAPTTLVEGDVVIFAKAGDTVVTGNTIVPGQDVLVAGAVALLPAGVVRGKDVNPGEFALCQVYGYHPNVKQTAVAIVAGATLITGAVGTVAAGAAGDDPSARIGVALIASFATNSRVGAFLKLM